MAAESGEVPVEAPVAEAPAQELPAEAEQENSAVEEPAPVEEDAAAGDGYLKVGAAAGSPESPDAVEGRSKSYMDAQEKAPLLDEAAASVAKAEPATTAPSAKEPESVTRASSKTEEMMKKMSEVDMTEYKYEIEHVAKEMWQTDINNGLTSQEAAARLQKYGYNRMTPPPKTPEWVKFCRELFGPFNLLLWTAGVLCFVAYGLDSSAPDNLILGCVLFFVVMATGIFSYVQVAASDNAMKKFAKMIPTACQVVRDGKTRKDIPIDELVPGDVITVKNGDKVPADIRCIECNQFKVDNASLTGESEPQKRSSAAQPDEKRAMEAKCLAFFTTLAVNGSCRGIVVRTGDDTVIGQIQSLVTGTKKAQTPINKEIEHFIHLISSVAIFLGVTFFIISLAIGTSWIKSVVFFIGIVVANVPEGLLATVTVCLALCAGKMAKKKVLVKNLESVETLGSTSCICSDKTGTLTQNKMTTVHLFFNNQVSRCQESMDKNITGPNEKESVDYSDPTFKALWRCGQLCNVAEFVYDEAGKSTREMPHQDRLTAGDASESAILKFCDRAASEITASDLKGKDEFAESEVYRPANEKVLNIPFNSKEKYAGSVHKQNNGDTKLLFVLKGAPERIIKRCGSIMIDGKVEPMTAEHQAEFDRGYASLARAGERVLGFSQLLLDENEFPADFKFADEEPFNGLTERKDLTFLGLFALIDPPREAVPQAVKDCMSGGIQVIMVTGDHPITAKAIAKSVHILRDPCPEDLAEKDGIIDGSDGSDTMKLFGALDLETRRKYEGDAKAMVVNGEDLLKLTEDDLDRVLAHDQLVFARTSPAQKLRIVQGCQRNGKIVAVTGDGVNDSPALKAADIGVAMGIAGSDVSKEAADMILLNDDFASIVVGVKEGRIVFDNLKKSIAYTLTSNIPEISPFLLYIIVGVPLPLSTIMILAIDLGTDMYPAISMAYEEAESDIMMRKPRNPKSDNLVTLKLLQYTYLQIGMIQACAGFFCYFVVMSDSGYFPSKLVGLRADWHDEDTVISDSYNCEWVFADREKMLSAAQTSYFTSIVIVQWADLIICKTRVLSVFQQGMRNMVMNKAIVFETCLAVFISYCPGLDVALKTGALQGQWWAPALTFSFIIWVYDEVRKYLMRKYRAENNMKAGWVERTTYY